MTDDITLSFNREQWGVIYDGLIAERARSVHNAVTNPEFAADDDERTTMCTELLGRISEATVQINNDNAPRCSMCRRRRDPLNPRLHPMDSYDYSPVQVVTGQPFGWYSGDDGQVCPEDMEKTVRGQGQR